MALKDNEEVNPQDLAEFSGAWNEDEEAPAHTEPQDEPIVDTAAAETVGTPEGEPAAVVVVAETVEVKDGGADEAALNAHGAADAKAAADAANTKASTNGSETQTSGEQEARAQSGDGATPAAKPADEEPGSGPAAPAEDEESIDAILADVPPEEQQKARSWAGRLRKLEEQLKAKVGTPAAAEGEVPQQQGGDVLDEAGDTAAQQGNTEMAQAMENVADQIQSGVLDLDEGMKQLTEDFGEPFVKLITSVAERAAAAAAERVAGEKVGTLGKSVEEKLAEQAARTHAQAIYEVHPDFIEVSEEDGFKKFVVDNKLQEVAEKGNARQINKLLTDYKKTKEQAPAGGGAAPSQAANNAAPAQNAVAAAAAAQPAPVDEEALADAEGIRSAGIRLPNRPKHSASDDFEAAWDEAP